MAIEGVLQPQILVIDEDLRLRKFDEEYEFALAWYQDPQTTYLVDGDYDAYDFDRLSRMYHYLDKQGELYFIELRQGDIFRPVGDVTFWQEDMPIVIGEPNCRGRHIGRRVIAALVQRGKELGYDHLSVDEIYDWNEGSRRCFESLGFRPYEKTQKGARYRLMLESTVH